MNRKPYESRTEIPKKSNILSNRYSILKYIGKAVLFVIGASLTYKAIKGSSDDNNELGNANEISDLFSIMSSSSRRKASIKVIPLHDKMMSNCRAIESSIRDPVVTKAIDKAEAVLSRKVFIYIFYLT